MPRSLRSPEQLCLQELLIAARKHKRMTQADVASRLDRPQSFVAKYEGGERRLDLIEFAHVARALGADPIELFGAALDKWRQLPSGQADSER